jgi:hypothetical protein
MNPASARSNAGRVGITQAQTDRAGRGENAMGLSRTTQQRAIDGLGTRYEGKRTAIPDASAAGGKFTFRRQIERMPLVDATPVTPHIVFHF